MVRVFKAFGQNEVLSILTIWPIVHNLITYSSLILGLHMLCCKHPLFTTIVMFWPNSPGPNFIELQSTTICLAWNFFLDKKTGLPTKFQFNLVILFLSRKRFHAKQIVVLSSSMKLGPDAITTIIWDFESHCPRLLYCYAQFNSQNGRQFHIPKEKNMTNLCMKDNDIQWSITRAQFYRAT